MYYLWVMFAIGCATNYFTMNKHIDKEDRGGMVYYLAIILLGLFQALIIYGITFFAILNYYAITDQYDVSTSISYLAPLPDCESKTKYVAYNYNEEDETMYSFLTLREDGTPEYHVKVVLDDDHVIFADYAGLQDEKFRPSYRIDVGTIPVNWLTKLTGLEGSPKQTRNKTLVIQEDQLVKLSDLPK